MDLPIYAPAWSSRIIVVVAGGRAYNHLRCRSGPPYHALHSRLAATHVAKIPAAITNCMLLT